MANDVCETELGVEEVIKTCLSLLLGNWLAGRLEGGRDEFGLAHV